MIKKSGIKAFSLFHFASSRFGSLLLTFARVFRERENPKSNKEKEQQPSMETSCEKGDRRTAQKRGKNEVKEDEGKMLLREWNEK